MSTTRSFLLGLFFLAAVGLLGYYTFFLTGFSLFKRQPEMVVHFARTNGLREGDSVQVVGMRWGRVKHLSYDKTAAEDRRVTVIAELNEPLELREGFEIAIEDATLLGGKNLTIDPGPADAKPIDPRMPLMGKVSPNPLSALGDLVKESKADLQHAVEDVAFLTRSVREGKGTIGRLLRDEPMAQNLADFMDNASKTVANLEHVSADLVAGKGLAGRLLSDGSLYDDLRDTSRKLSTLLDNANAVALDVKKGQGLAGRLINDESWAREVDELVKHVNEIARKIDRGDGTVARLINDDALARDTEKIIAAVARGEGTVGKLMMKDEIYENIRDTTDNLAVVTGTVRSGQGSLGRLIMDEEIYVQLKTMFSIVQRALEEYREAAPITTFTAIFFNAF